MLACGPPPLFRAFIYLVLQVPLNTVHCLHITTLLSEMDPRFGFEAKRMPREKMIPRDDCIPEEDVEDDAEEEEGGGVGFGDDDQKRKGVHGRRGSGGGGGGCGGVSPPSCQVERCGADLTEAKRYHRRHKVCEIHAKAPAVVVAGLRQRFCQQCSRFHELSEFDEAKRSCRRRLAGHNERRRKSMVESYGESSGRKGNGHQMKESQCRQIDERGRLIQMNLQENSSYTKRSQIR